MKFKYRLIYFSGGFTVGLIMLFFILSGKKTSCAYGPQSRTLKHLRLKQRTFSETSLQFFQQNHLDTAEVNNFLADGKVLFSESDTSLDSCKQYVVQGMLSERNIKVRIANCKETATVMTAAFSE